MKEIDFLREFISSFEYYGSYEISVTALLTAISTAATLSPIPNFRLLGALYRFICSYAVDREGIVSTDTVRVWIEDAIRGLPNLLK
jgi:hypothetical protein